MLIFFLFSIRGFLAQSNWELLLEKKAIAEINRMAINDDNELLLKRVDDHKFIKSTDLGETWFDASTNNPTDLIYSDSFDSLDDLVVYNNNSSAIFSIDFGSTWEIIPGTELLSPFRTICIADSQTILIGTANFGAYKYHLGDTSVVEINSGLDQTTVNYLGKSSGNKIFCQLANKKIFFSLNEGNSWVQRVLPLDGYINSHIVTDETQLIISIKGNLYRTSNSGASWLKLPIPLYQYFNGFAKVANRLYCTTYSAVYSTTNMGQSWTHEIDVDFPVSIVKTNSGGIIVASQESGILRNLDGGEIWDTILLEAHTSASFSKVKTHNETDIFAGAVNRGLFISSNAGIDWEYSGFEGPGKRIKNIEFDSDNNVFVLCNQIYFSSDNGKSWELRSPVDNQNPFAYETFGDFQIVEETGELIATTGNGDIYSSHDKGMNWSRLYSFQWYPSPSINNITVINGTIYLASLVQSAGFDMFFYLMKSTDANNWVTVLDGGYHYIIQQIGGSNILAANYFTVFRSDNFGDTWQEINLDERVLCFLYKGNENIFAGTLENGVYLSNDEGFSWSKLNLNGLSSKKINSLDYLNNGYLIAGTEHGVFKSEVTLTTVNEEDLIKLNFDLSQNYPNPFNPTTKIKFTIPTSPQTPLLSKERGRGEVVSLKVYDLLGREVATLVNKPMTAGTYEVEFDGSNLPSGVYFYKLISGKFTDTKKFILMK